MRFEYGDYLRDCFSQPMLSLAWTLLFIVLLLIPAVLTLWKKRALADRQAAGKRVLIIVCLLVIIGFPLPRQIGVLVKTNGIAILQDRNAAPLTLTGKIDAIEEPERNAATRYIYDGKHVYGVWLTIDSERYYAVTSGTLSPGDTVTLEYMPKSRCVLYLAPAESTIAED